MCMKEDWLCLVFCVPFFSLAKQRSSDDYLRVRETVNLSSTEGTGVLHVRSTFPTEVGSSKHDLTEKCVSFHLHFFSQGK